MIEYEANVIVSMSDPFAYTLTRLINAKILRIDNENVEGTK